MENLDHRGVAKQLVKRLQRDALDQRIDQNRIAVIRPRHGQLDQAKFGIIGPLAQEFGIDGHVIMAARFGAIGGQIFGCCECSHQGSIFARLVMVVPTP